MKLNYKCEICNQICHSIKGLTMHLRITHSNILLEDYYKKYIQLNAKGICKKCGNETKFRNLSKGYQIYCKNCNNTVHHICKICKQDVCLQGIIRHLNRHNITLKDYYDNFLLKENENKCKICGNTTTFINLSLGYRKYCSNICAGKDNDVLEKRKNTVMLLYGIDNVCKLPQSLGAGFNAYREKTGLRSPSCDIENVHKGRHKYSYNNIMFDSSWELSYYLWLQDNNINFIYHPTKKFSYSYNGEEHLYFVDFQVNDEYIELKGPQFFDKMGNFINPYDRTLDELYKQKYNCMINNGIKIIRDCKIYLDYVKQKYGKNFIKEHKRY